MAATGGKATGKKAGRAGSRETVDSSTNSGYTKNASKPLIDLDFVRALIAAVDDSGIDSLEISRAGTRIRVAKTPPPAPNAPGPAAATVAQASGTAREPGSDAAASETASPPESNAGPASATAPPRTDLHEVKSPMVGTFYRAPAPDAPPYAEVGSTIVKGQTLCILEAMKLMNELESEVDGTVREVLVTNAEPVEYGQVLFRVELKK
ncbi:MAG: acetyl-CoA carboxylase biotin carboxyl carrier protein [Longimicrobiales bacterium]